MNVNLNQSREDFKKWLGLQKVSATAIAGDPCHCWLAMWFEAQGIHLWGVFPQHYQERYWFVPGNASQEILLSDPDEEGFSDSDRIPLSGWACEFEKEIDRLYYRPLQNLFVSRDQALAVLAGVER